MSILNYAIKTGMCLTGYFAIQYLLRKTEWSQNTKWYLIHSVGNATITILALKDTFGSTMDPMTSSKLISNWHDLDCLQSYPIVVMSALHLYHIIVHFNQMVAIDWIHHILSGFVVGSICTFYIKAPIINHGLMFMCGLPGGIDYSLLFLDKIGVIDRQTEKKINMYLNNWIRSPGILLNCYIGYVNFIYGKFKYGLPIMLSIFILNMWNAIYFAQRVTYNCGISDRKNKAILN